MIPEENLFARLRQLLAEQVLPRSVCGRHFLTQVTPLLQTGVLVEERAGAGRRLVVADSNALRQFIEARFPNASLDPGASARETGVARYRNTKALPSDTAEIISLRAWSETALVQPTMEALGHQAVSATLAHGVFAFLLRPECSISLHGPWALVENPAMFVHFERLKLPTPAVLYGRGRVSTRMLDWLATQSAPDFTLLHLPDYDPAGLIEHQRVRARLGSRVSLHLPADLEERFARLSNPALLKMTMTRSMLAALRDSTCEQILKTVDLIDRFNGGLEQEALLVNISTTVRLP